MKKWIVWGILLLVVSVVVIGAMSRRGPRLPEVTTATIGKTDLVSRVTCNGKVQPRRKIELSANIAGQILNLAVREGDRVRKGDFLMQIDKTSLQASADSSRAALQALLSDRDATRATLERARLEFERARTAFDKSIISQSEFERMRTTADAEQANLAAIESRIDQARATFTGARDTLNKTTITAPMDGVVTKLNVEEGEVAVIGTMNNAGTVLMTIADLSVMEAVMEVDETDVPAVAIGQKASLLIDAYPDTAFEGNVTDVGASPIAQTAGSTAGIDFEVKIRIQNPPEGLKPGLSVTADIVTGTRLGAVSVPLQAIVLRDSSGAPEPPASGAEPETPGIHRQKEVTVASRRRDQEGVFALDGETVHFVPITTGITGELDIEVLSGIDAGRVVVSGPFRTLRTLKDGDKVAKAKAGGPAAEARP